MPVRLKKLNSIGMLNSITDCIDRLALLKNGDLVSGSTDQTIRIWSQEDGTVRKKFSVNNFYIFSYAGFALKLLDNGDLVSGSGDKTIKVWDVREGNNEKEYIGEFGSLAV